MPFALLDAEGHILAVYNDMVEGAVEVAPDDPALKAFLYQNHPDAQQKEQWVQSDLALARVVEDLIDVLIEKGVFMFTDLPEGAQKKLLERRGLRKEFAYVENLFGNEENFGGDNQGGQGGGGFL
jgi:hypothetical protein